MIKHKTQHGSVPSVCSRNPMGGCYSQRAKETGSLFHPDNLAEVHRPSHLPRPLIAAGTKQGGLEGNQNGDGVANGCTKSKMGHNKGMQRRSESARTVPCVSPRKIALNAEGYKRISNQSPVVSSKQGSNASDKLLKKHTFVSKNSSSVSSSKSSLLLYDQYELSQQQCTDSVTSSAKGVHGVALRMVDDELCAEMDESWREIGDRGLIVRSASKRSSNGQGQRTLEKTTAGKIVTPSSRRVSQQTSEAVEINKKTELGACSVIKRNESARSRSPGKRLFSRCFSSSESSLGSLSTQPLHTTNVVDTADCDFNVLRRTNDAAVFSGNDNSALTGRPKVPNSLALTAKFLPLKAVPLASCESPDDLLYLDSEQDTPARKTTVHCLPPAHTNIELSSTIASPAVTSTASILQESNESYCCSESVTLCPSHNSENTHDISITTSNVDELTNLEAKVGSKRPVSFPGHALRRTANRTLSETHPIHLDTRRHRAMSVDSDNDVVTVSGSVYRQMMNELTNMKLMLLKLKTFIQEENTAAIVPCCSVENTLMEGIPNVDKLPFLSDNSVSLVNSKDGCKSETYQELAAENDNLKKKVIELEAKLNSQQIVMKGMLLPNGFVTSHNKAVQVEIENVLTVLPSRDAPFIRCLSLDKGSKMRKPKSIVSVADGHERQRPLSCVLLTSSQMCDDNLTVSYETVNTATSGYHSETSSPRDVAATPADDIRPVSEISHLHISEQADHVLYSH